MALHAAKEIDSNNNATEYVKRRIVYLRKSTANLFCGVRFVNLITRK
jgi:ribosomal protein L35AE/L33A